MADFPMGTRCNARWSATTWALWKSTLFAVFLLCIETYSLSFHFGEAICFTWVEKRMFNIDYEQFFFHEFVELLSSSFSWSSVNVVLTIPIQMKQNRLLKEISIFLCFNRIKCILFTKNDLSLFACFDWSFSPNGFFCGKHAIRMDFYWPRLKI